MFRTVDDVVEVRQDYTSISDQETQKRMNDEGRVNRQPWTLAKVKKILASWHIYMLSLLYA